MFHLAYVFERFPSFTQTFCVREVLQLERMGVRPLIFSIRDTRNEEIRHFPQELFDRVHFLPPRDELVERVRQWKDAHLLPRAAALVLRHWGERPDKMRVYEAAYIAKVISDLGAAGPVHAHSHFAGVGARTCWWLRRFAGLSFSFTAHANDIFCKPGEQLPEFRQLFEDAALIVTVSDYTAAQLRGRFPAAAARVRRVYNGLDLEPLIAARAGADRSRAAGGILSVGRLIEKKGFDDLITACAALRDKGIAYHCRIVGEGPLEAALRSQIAGLGLHGRVTLTGPLGMEQIVRLLAEETQVFALACMTEQDGGRDNLPTVLMEAMAASLPCVSTRLAGVPEMVIDGRTGLVCDERRPADFAALLERLLSDPALCEQMGAAGLAHAQAHFARETTGRQLVEKLAEFGGLRFDAALGVTGSYVRRLPHLFSRQLRHRLPKAHGKSFDLDEFMRG
ncbi:MAG: glycosyltransferase family 4 protein [Verrucomicrobiaceae bacterium]|nr:glycosyltransferase family 4 protein [Verrucomicrobiaceae bacterium]